MAHERCGGFTYESWGPSGNNPKATHVYEFLSPGWLTFVRPGGRIETLNYGITERVEILQISLRYAGARGVPLGGIPGQLTTIPCPDGSIIVDWDPDLHMRMLYGSLLGGDKGLPDL